MADLTSLICTNETTDEKKINKKLRGQVIAEGLPNVYEAKVSAIRKSKRVQLNFSSIPEPIKDLFLGEMKQKGMVKTEFLLELMKNYGLDVPDYIDLDGRHNR